MNKTEYMVYWTDRFDIHHGMWADSLSQALIYVEQHRKNNCRFVTMCAENPDQIGSMGVDSVVDGLLPDGQEYVYKTGRDRGREPR